LAMGYSFLFKRLQRILTGNVLPALETNPYSDYTLK